MPEKSFMNSEKVGRKHLPCENLGWINPNRELVIQTLSNTVDRVLKSWFSDLEMSCLDNPG